MKIANSLTQQFVLAGIIKEEDRELYAYGIWQGIALLYNFLTLVILGLIFDMLWQSIVFMMAYGSIRPYAGGYHARTPFRCYMSSVVIITTVLWLIKYIQWNEFICLSMISFASIVIFLLAPVEDENKPLDELEQAVFKKKARILLCILFGLFGVFWLIGLETVSICISMSLTILAIMLIFGKLKNLIV